MSDKELLDLTHPMIHYLLAIHELKEELGYARATDIAKKVERTKGSVSVALAKLKTHELITEDNNRFLDLTEKGHDFVHQSLTSKTLFFFFLKDILGVEEKQAKRDSCVIEHLVSEHTLKALFGFLKESTKTEPKFVSGTSQNINELLGKFETFKEFKDAN